MFFLNGGGVALRSTLKFPWWMEYVWFLSVETIFLVFHENGMPFLRQYKNQSCKKDTCKMQCELLEKYMDDIFWWLKCFQPTFIYPHSHLPGTAAEIGTEEQNQGLAREVLEGTKPRVGPFPLHWWCHDFPWWHCCLTRFFCEQQIAKCLSESVKELVERFFWREKKTWPKMDGCLWFWVWGEAVKLSTSIFFAYSIPMRQMVVYPSDSFDICLVMGCFKRWKNRQIININIKHDSMCIYQKLIEPGNQNPQKSKGHRQKCT